VTIQEQIKNLPQAPGVYFFKDAKGKILYIGKATSLRSRVQSYFRGENVAGRSEWISLMISQVVEIDFQETDSVLEALILESNLIKKHQPKYNTLEKDDKSFSYFVITREEFSRVLIFRKTDIDFENKTTKGDVKAAAIFGPYTSKHQMEVALKIIRKIFPFHALRQKTEKGCLDFQLGKCPGPYAGAISKEDYRKNIRGIKMILEGKKKRLVTTLEKEMSEYAKKDEFEKAAEVRNRIFALQHIRDIALIGRDFEGTSSVTSQQSTNMRIEAYDISNISGTNAVGSMVVFENGKPNKTQYRKFKIKTIEGSDDVGSMQEVLTRRMKNDWEMPDLILLDGGQGHANMAGNLVCELGLDVLIVAVAKGKTRKNLNFHSPAGESMTNKIPITQFPKELQDFLNDKNLVKSIMDEAHRFAITFHRKLRRKSALK
jgi:excinuclease ABC subunit C